MLLPRDDLELLLREFGAKDLGDLMTKRTSTDKIVKPSLFTEAPRRVEISADECKKLCDKNGMRYHPGYEGRIIERVTTTEAPDRYGDIVRAKGIDNVNYRKNAVVLFSHNHGDFPVGKSLKEWIDKSINGWRSWDLYFGDEIDPTGKSDLTFRMVDSGAMPGGSIGFIPGQSKCDHTEKERSELGIGKFGVEYMTCEKLEHSACSVPANPEALSNCLKSIEAKRLKAMFAVNDVDRMFTEKMLDAELADVFASILGVQRTVSIPSAPVHKSKKESREIVFRPYPNEHAARVRDPEDFEADSFRRKNITTGVDIIIGKLKDEDEGSMETQAYRFDKEEFTAAEARKWLDDNDVEYIDFEPASEKGITINNNIDLSQANQDISALDEKIKTLSETLEASLKSFETRSSELLAATTRALTALESRTRSVGLYDRKEILDVLKIPK